jgi:hypothetical protein
LNYSLWDGEGEEKRDENDDNGPTVETDAAYRVARVTRVPTKNRHLFGVDYEPKERKTIIIHVESEEPFGHAPISLSFSTDDDRHPYKVGDYLTLKLISLDSSKTLNFPSRKKHFGES